MNIAPDPAGSTRFAPAERASVESLKRSAELCLRNPIVQTLLESISGYALILNAQRQCLAGNVELFDGLGCPNPQELCGLRPGELMNCIHAAKGPGGCGTSEACAQCGAVLTILTSQLQGIPANGECKITMRREGHLVSGEFRVRSSPLVLEGEELMVFILQDTSAEKRRDALEHTLREEMMPLAERLTSSLTREEGSPRSLLTAREIHDLSLQLASELLSQKILASAEDGSLRVEPREVGLGEVFDELRGHFLHSPLVEGRKLETDAGSGGTLWTDPVLVLRILAELVENAFEATPIGGRVSVLHGRTAKGHTFVVQNDEPIPERAMTRIFQRSFSTKALRGRGLGTYLARLLAERYLHGSLTFASDAARGTRFALVLPDREESAPPKPEATQAAEPGTTPSSAPQRGAATVLVIDDSRTSRSILTAVLSQEHRVLAASTGEEGLAMALEHGPDLILLDVVMPGLDGFAVCARLKSEPLTEEIPVLFLSALGGEADETLALEAGAIDFITKPISPVVVAARVRNHLELKRSKDQLRALSLADGLTGIANRRRFDHQLEAEWQRTRRRKLPMAVIMGDVDHFKLYNDTYGHAAGDGCLKAVAHCFANAMQRPGDLAARYGGEEFVCILPETSLDGAMEVAQRVCECVSAQGIPHSQSSAADHVTVSLGVAACYPADGGSALELLAAADARLYDAKHGGRNRALS